ncbi:MAG: hypothetical protein ACPG4X_15860 [Pikeienuella sp.]
MRTRKEAVEFIQKQFRGGPKLEWPIKPDDLEPDEEVGAWHYGRIELRQLMDFIYGGPPVDDSEKVGRGK